MKNLFYSLLVLLSFSVFSSFTTSTFDEGDKEAHVSWYGPGFHGKLTASGDVYDMNDLTCAHKKLPFGTQVKFTNPRNGKTVVATVNDRGPFVKGRTFDLSKGAFEAIADTDRGVIKIKYKILN